MSNSKALMLLVSLTMYSSALVFGLNTANIGVCYGLLGNNLPSPTQVVNLLGVLNQDIPALASGVQAAQSWFTTNVQPYVHDVDIMYISVGNEVVPGQFSESIVPAMQNLQNVLMKNNLSTKATTVVHAAVLGSSYPPSTGQFTENARPFMRQIIRFLSSQNTPVLVNLYPYFPYASDPTHIQLGYAQLSMREPVVHDGNLNYSNLLDAMLDAFYSAMEKEGVNNVNIIISETGWPHAGNGNFTTPNLAATYNRNFINRVNGGGTPKKPNVKLEGYLFDMIDENAKDPGVEQNWGLFNPSMKPNYELF